MVHLSQVPTDHELNASLSPISPVVGDFSRINFDESDDAATTVYGSKWAAADLPKHEMPDREMPKEVAYRMIKDDLTLDGVCARWLAMFLC